MRSAQQAQQRKRAKLHGVVLPIVVILILVAGSTGCLAPRTVIVEREVPVEVTRLVTEEPDREATQVALDKLTLEALATAIKQEQRATLAPSATSPAVQTTDTVEPTNSAQPTLTPSATSTTRPTDTPIPTSTSIPTSTPLPADTPTATATPQPTMDVFLANMVESWIWGGGPSRFENSLGSQGLRYDSVFFGDDPVNLAASLLVRYRSVVIWYDEDPTFGADDIGNVLEFVRRGGGAWINAQPYSQGDLGTYLYDIGVSLNGGELHGPALAFGQHPIANGVSSISVPDGGYSKDTNTYYGLRVSSMYLTQGQPVAWISGRDPEANAVVAALELGDGRLVVSLIMMEYLLSGDGLDTYDRERFATNLMDWILRR